jgi:hypothetical protein
MPAFLFLRGLAASALGGNLCVSIDSLRHQTDRLNSIRVCDEVFETLVGMLYQYDAVRTLLHRAKHPLDERTIV